MHTRIFICHHVPPALSIANDLFATLVSGSPASCDETYLTDFSGSNIAEQNVFSEIRHQYFVWKNLIQDLNYVGFEHYRRMFFLDPMTQEKLEQIAPTLYQCRRYLASDLISPYLEISAESYRALHAMRLNMDSEDIERVSRQISNYDIITQRPSTVGNLETQWQTCGGSIVPWSLVTDAFKKCTYFAKRTCYVSADMRSTFWNNMYIMKTDIFVEYITLLMECIEWLSERIDVTNFARAWGGVAERIFNLYLFTKMMHRPSIRLGHLPVLVHSKAYIPKLQNNLSVQVSSV